MTSMDATELPQTALTAETLEAIVIQTVAVLRGVDGRLHPSREAQDMPSAWVKQRADQVRDLGADAAPHYCYWIDPDGRQRSKSCGAGKDGERLAHRLKKQREAELLLGTYGSCLEKSWVDFEAEYLAKAAGLSPKTLKETRTAFAHFRRLCKPGRVSKVTTAAVDAYKTARLTERGLREGTTVSHATLNKELRHLRAALRKAKKWGYTREAPDVDMLRELGRLPCYVPPEHFAALYAACKAARLPRVQGIDPPDYWRALLVLIYQTGWRIEQVLSLCRGDLNLATGELFSAGEDNKGGRDVKLVLPALAVEHLGRLPSFAETLFPWPHRQATLWREFHRVQDAAGVKPERKPYYGFHDLRRAFATLNADRLTPDALQRLMQHRDRQTTQRYINMGRQLRPAAENVFVPDLPKLGTA